MRKMSSAFVAPAEVHRRDTEEEAWYELKTKADLAVLAVSRAEEAVEKAKGQASPALLAEALARANFEKEWGRVPEQKEKFPNCKGE
ncbi:MAG TPA: hypothetical protein VJH06_03925 [Candidatus Paceibacterota bacterium]